MGYFAAHSIAARFAAQVALYVTITKHFSAILNNVLRILKYLMTCESKNLIMDICTFYFHMLVSTTYFKYLSKVSTVPICERWFFVQFLLFTSEKVIRPT